MHEHPLRRVDDLVITESGLDLLVYDKATHTLHTLNALSANVFGHCNGTTTRAHLIRDTDADPNTVELALDQLQHAGLLEGSSTSAPNHTTSRRRLLRKAGIAIGAPAIVSMTAPLASAATSVTCTPSGGICELNDPGACCSGACTNYSPPNPPVCA